MLASMLMRQNARCLVGLGGRSFCSLSGANQSALAKTLAPMSVTATSSHKSLVPAKTAFSTTAVKKSGDHGKLWTVERAVALSMVPGLTLPFFYTTPLTDAIFVTLCVVHAHWGVENILVDYVRPCLFGGSTLIPRLSIAALWAVSGFTLGALYYFSYNDVGFVAAIKMVWTHTG